MRDFRTVGTKIVAIGRNYAEHAAELGNPLPRKPVVFSKATTAYIGHGGTVVAPVGCTRLQHEVELAVVVGRRASRLRAADAMQHVAGYALALDMTDRTMQSELKSAGLPWFLSKSFDTSCPVSDFVPVHRVPDPADLRLGCSVNGERRQCGSTGHMVFGIGALMEYITGYVTLVPGDLLLTGTPSGVSDLADGDRIACSLHTGGDELLATLDVDVQIPALRNCSIAADNTSVI